MYHTFTIIAHFWRLHILSAIEYRASALAQVIGMMLNNSFFVILWGIFFSTFHTIGGITQNQYMILYSISGLSFALVWTLMGGHLELPTKISEGRIDNELLTPGKPLPKLLAREWDLSGVGDFIFFMIIPWIFSRDLLSIELMLRMSVAVMIGAIVFGSLMIFGASLSFFMGNSETTKVALLEGTLGGSMYPPGIFEVTWIRALVYSVLPAGLFAFLPFQFTLYGDWSAFLYALLGALAWLTIALMTWKYGLKRYESGNLGGFTG